MKYRLRILFPKADSPNKDITHWIVAADQKHKPIQYGHQHIACFKNGTSVKGFFRHKEF